MENVERTVSVYARGGNMSCRRVPFTEADTIKFIDEYQRHECLWNIQAPEYRRLDLKNRAYLNLAETFNLSVEAVKKINNIRSTYLQEKKKVKASGRTGSAPEDIYVPSLVWYHQCAFLDDVVVPRRTSSSLEGISADELEEWETIECDTPERGRRKGPKNDSNAYIKEAVDRLVQPMDDSESFAMSLAAQLRLLPTVDRAKAMLDLQTVISGYTIRHAERRSSVDSPNLNADASLPSSNTLLPTNQPPPPHVPPKPSPPATPSYSHSPMIVHERSAPKPTVHVVSINPINSNLPNRNTKSSLSRLLNFH